jgi:hypothetical protein
VPDLEAGQPELPLFSGRDGACPKCQCRCARTKWLRRPGPGEIARVVRRPSDWGQDMREWYGLFLIGGDYARLEDFSGFEPADWYPQEWLGRHCMICGYRWDEAVTTSETTETEGAAVNDTPIQSTQAPGILGYDVAMPVRPLLPAWTPFRYDPAEIAANARRAEAERRRTEARVAQETSTALKLWRAFREQHAENPIVAAVLDIHQPEAGPRGVVCTECLDDDCDGAVASEWPCGTYDVMQAAAEVSESEEHASA